MIAGRTITRDRPAEFTATGAVDDLIERTAAARTRLNADLAAVDGTAATAHPPRRDSGDLPYGRTQGGVVLHIVEELYQHLGHMELTRDLVRAANVRPP